MRPRCRKLIAFLFGQNFPAVVKHVVYEDPDHVGYEVRPVQYGANGMCADAQKAYLAWVNALPEAEKV